MNGPSIKALQRFVARELPSFLRRERECVCRRTGARERASGSAVLQDPSPQSYSDEQVVEGVTAARFIGQV